MQASRALILCLPFLAACSRGPNAPVVVAPVAAAAAVEAPSAEAQRSFLKKVDAALKGHQLAALQALGYWEHASPRAQASLPAILNQQLEDCGGKIPCATSLEASAKFAGLAMTAPAFGELVIERNDGEMITHAKLPVGVKDGAVVLVTEAQ
jgi:hypothetical protein